MASQSETVTSRCHGASLSELIGCISAYLYSCLFIAEGFLSSRAAEAAQAERLESCRLGVLGRVACQHKLSS